MRDDDDACVMPQCGVSRLRKAVVDLYQTLARKINASFCEYKSRVRGQEFTRKLG